VHGSNTSEYIVPNKVAVVRNDPSASWQEHPLTPKEDAWIRATYVPLLEASLR